MILCAVLCLGGFAQAQEAAAPHEVMEHSALAEGHETAEEGIPMAAPHLGQVGPFVITSSMVLCWVVAVFLIVFAQIATRNIKSVPTGAQNFWEWLVELLFNFLETILGHKTTLKTFWFFATVFIFILFNNWSGLIPGVGSIGWGHPDANGALHHISHPLFRGGNADFNMTFGMAIVFFTLWIIWSLQEQGPAGVFSHIFVYQGDAAGFMRLLLFVIFFAVGFLEIISILIRPMTLTFRLFGNIYAGETLLDKMFVLGGNFGFLAALPFYGLELMVGLIQALVFMLLTAVFTSLMCSHDDHAEAAH